MTQTKIRCLILACGSTLRGDDGVGLWLADWAEKRFESESRLRVIAAQQWTPEMVEDVARAESVLFVDCSADSAPGTVLLFPVEAAATAQKVSTHHLGAAQMLALSRDLYDSLPREALLLTVGAASFELTDEFSPAVNAALPEACRLLEETVLRWLRAPA